MDLFFLFFEKHPPGNVCNVEKKEFIIIFKYSMSCSQSVTRVIARSHRILRLSLVSSPLSLTALILCDSDKYVGLILQSTFLTTA